jgi:pimeloyl-ACP methyl ester carboxylesterase
MQSPVIYLHGFASGPGSKKAQLFRRRFGERGVALEIPDLDAGDFARLTVSGQLAAIEEVARGEAVSLMGSSLGGYLAALYAARHPEVARLVLMAPAFGFGRRFLDSIGPAEAERWRQTGWRAVFNYAAGREERLWWRLIEDALQFEEFPSVPQPTLLFHGRHDNQVPHALSREFARQHPNASLELFDDGHELLDSVDRIWDASAAFLGLADS